jgi:arginase family enzyme
MHLTRCIGETTHGGGRLNGTVRIGARLRHAREAGRLSLADGQRFTGYDIVEVAPAYDTNAQTTALLAANIAYELLTLTALCRA